MKFSTMTAAGAFACMLAISSTAIGHGAIAIGEPADVGKDGLAMGWSADIATPEGASRQALYWCHNVTDPPVKAETRALCKLVQSFSHACFGIAGDKRPHTPGWGWAMGDTKEIAAAAALEKCKTTAGTDPQAKCEILLNDCDVEP